MAFTNSELKHNETPVPSFDGGARGDENKPVEILYSTVGLTQKGVTLLGGVGIIPAGAALGRITASKKWVAYDNTASDGTQVCRGILRDARDTGTGAGAKDILGNIVLAGMLRNSKLSGVDSNAITDLNARQDTVLDIFQF